MDLTLPTHTDFSKSLVQCITKLLMKKREDTQQHPMKPISSSRPSIRLFSPPPPLKKKTFRHAPHNLPWRRTSTPYPYPFPASPNSNHFPPPHTPILYPYPNPTPTSITPYPPTLCPILPIPYAPHPSNPTLLAPVKSDDAK